MRSILTLSILLMVSFAKAQDLLQQVPSDAKVVLTIRGDQFLELMSVNEFNNSFIGKKILKEASANSELKLKSIDDIGVNLSSPFYYYLRGNDSMYYNCFLVQVKNQEQFTRFMKEKSHKEIIVNGNKHTVFDDDSSMVWQWNDRQLLIVKSFEKYGFFDNSEVMKRYGIQDLYSDDAYVTPPPYETDTVAAPIYVEPPLDAVAEDTAEPIIAMPPPYEEEKPVVKKPAPAKKVTGKKSVTKKKATISKPARPVPPIADEEPGIIPQVDTVEITSSDDLYYSRYDENRRIKKSLVAKWTSEYAENVFAKPFANSIVSNPSFSKNINPTDEATVWVGNGKELFSGFFPARYLANMNFANSWNSMTGILRMEKDKILLTGKMELNDTLAASYRRLYDSRLNKKLLKYVNEDHMIGYMTCVLNSKNYLEEYPKMMANMYGAKYKDEALLGADLFNLFLDEDAVGKLLKGDGIFVFSGLSQKEVTYKTYDFDDNYKSIEIEKKKKEMLPDFLFMASTEDAATWQKLINYGIKKDVITSVNGYYKFNIRNNEFMDVYFLIKDGILFIGSNAPDVEKIIAGKYEAKISKDRKKQMQANYFTSYFSPHKLSGQIPLDEIGDLKKMNSLNELLNSSGDIHFTSNGIRGNVVSGEIKMDVPANETNSLKYLFSLIEKAVKDLK